MSKHSGDRWENATQSTYLTIFGGLVVTLTFDLDLNIWTVHLCPQLHTKLWIWQNSHNQFVRYCVIALYYKPCISKVLTYGPCVTMASHSFTCFGWYSLRLPTKRWPGWADLDGWSHTEINVPHREMNPDTVTHPTTNRARCSMWSCMYALTDSLKTECLRWLIASRGIKTEHLHAGK